MNEPLTTVFLDDETAKLFVQFQKRRMFMLLLEQKSVWDIRNGSIEIHFDKDGLISSVDKHERYRV